MMTSGWVDASGGKLVDKRKKGNLLYICNK